MTTPNWESEDSEKLLKGIQLFHEKEFFLAHDAWEEVWQFMRGRRRIFWQALIQLAIAFYHLENNNNKGYLSMKAKSLQKMEHICDEMKSGLPCQLKEMISGFNESESVDVLHKKIAHFIQPSLLEF